ncbi:MAG TPA: hypothetical protein VIF62_08065 [Labilithrix sp.]
MRSSKLFHTVVVYGAALGGCQKPSVVDAPMGPSDASAQTDDAGQAEPSPPPTVATMSARPVATPSGSARPCPPGSELPFPPCYYIR